jgi:long-chain fatty acid transport protein
MKVATSRETAAPVSRVGPAGASVLAALLVLAPATAGAGGFGLFQHGGRAVGQAGALTARAHEPSALTYNPAAITRLSGLQLQAGLDFGNSEDSYRSATGEFSAHHVIQFPPAAYLTWRNPEDGAPVALGLGLDAPFWTLVDWDPALFPGRFLTRRFGLEVFELHGVLAFEMAEGWSLGGGVRYLYGQLEQEDNAIATVPLPGGGPPALVEVERNAEADVDALAWDLALHYAAPAWGWGAVFRSEAELAGNGGVAYRPRDVGDPAVAELARQRFVPGRAGQAFTLPWELRGGWWFAPYPELRIELDLAYANWSTLERTDVTFRPDPVGQGTDVTRRNWQDTLSLRLGLEGEITDNVQLYGGLGWEPSPVRGNTIEPGFPRGDAVVYAAGFSYNFPQLSFDLAYSFHDHGNRGARGQEPLTPGRAGSYSSHEQVWGFSARWRW